MQVTKDTYLLDNKWHDCLCICFAISLYCVEILNLHFLNQFHLHYKLDWHGSLINKLNLYQLSQYSAFLCIVENTGLWSINAWPSNMHNYIICKILWPVLNIYSSVIDKLSRKLNNIRIWQLIISSEITVKNLHFLVGFLRFKKIFFKFVKWWTHQEH